MIIYVVLVDGKGKKKGGGGGVKVKESIYSYHIESKKVKKILLTLNQECLRDRYSVRAKKREKRVAFSFGSWFSHRQILRQIDR